MGVDVHVCSAMPVNLAVQGQNLKGIGLGEKDPVSCGSAPEEEGWKHDDDITSWRVEVVDLSYNLGEKMKQPFPGAEHAGATGV